MLKPEIGPMVYKLLFPRPNPADPVDLQHHISRNLVAEVRQEIARFYGNLTLIEAQYPGLDYTRPGHRLRLGAYQWHRRLFRAFDLLRLSDCEIYTLCTWEGTKWAKEKYEGDHGTTIKDTTWDEIEVVRRRSPSAVFYNSHYSQVHGDSHYEEDEAMEGLEEEEEVEEGELELGEDSEDDLVSHSVGVALNQRLLAASEARARGEEAVIDPDWEQWMKEAAERGNLPMIDASTGSSHHGASRWSHSSPRAFGLGSHASFNPTLSHTTSTHPRTGILQPILPASRLRMSTSVDGTGSQPPGGTAT